MRNTCKVIGIIFWCAALKSNLLNTNNPQINLSLKKYKHNITFETWVIADTEALAKQLHETVYINAEEFIFPQYHPFTTDNICSSDLFSAQI